MLAAVVFASAPLVLVFARLVIFDMLLTACVTAALYCLLQGRRTGAAWSWWSRAAVAMALGVLCKGPVGFVVPLLAWAVARGALPPPPRRGGTAPAFAAIGLFAALLVPWLASVHAAEPGFLRYAIVDETLLRLTSAARFRRGQPPYFYAGVLAWAGGVWSVLLVGLVPQLWRRWRTGGREAHAIAFAARAAVAMVLFFTCSASKRPQYLLPALVPLAVLVAIAIVGSRAARGDDRARLRDCGRRRRPRGHCDRGEGIPDGDRRRELGDTGSGRRRRRVPGAVGPRHCDRRPPAGGCAHRRRRDGARIGARPSPSPWRCGREPIHACAGGRDSSASPGGRRGRLPYQPPLLSAPPRSAPQPRRPRASTGNVRGCHAPTLLRQFVLAGGVRAARHHRRRPEVLVLAVPGSAEEWSRRTGRPVSMLAGDRETIVLRAGGVNRDVEHLRHGRRGGASLPRQPSRRAR